MAKTTKKAVKKAAGKKEEAKGKKEYAPDKVRNIGIFAESDTAEFRVTINTFGERNLVDTRQWYKKKNDKDFNPGKGLSIAVEHLPEFIVMLKKAQRRAIKAGLLEAAE